MPYRHPDFNAPALKGAPECRFEPAPADTTLPDGFMSTTNFPTYVRVGGKWRMPQNPRMDAHLVWSPASERLEVKEFRLVAKGDLVAVATATRSPFRTSRNSLTSSRLVSGAHTRWASMRGFSGMRHFPPTPRRQSAGREPGGLVRRLSLP